MQRESGDTPSSNGQPAFAIAIAGACAAVAYVTTRSPTATVAVAFFILSAEALALLPALAHAYTRFDPSADTPP